jgi:hypothetical protein
MADRGGIQLLPETRKKIEIKIPGENRMLYIGSTALAVVVAVYVGLSWYVNTLNDELTTINASIINLKRDKEAEKNLANLQKQTNLVAKLIDNHIFWTKALARVSGSIVPGVQMKSFSGVLSKKETFFKAVAPNYSTIARQLASLVADDGIVTLDLGNAKALNTGGYEFTVQMKFNPDKYLLKRETK